MIPFNRPSVIHNEEKFIQECLQNRKFSGDGPFTLQCHAFLDNFFAAKSLLTTSCTDALELSALLSEIEIGDEVIMPSYTFVSTANAFVLRGAKIVFVDIDPKTMNIDTKMIANAITNKTKAIIVVHYAGWSCNMDDITALLKDTQIILIEDAAQALGSTFKGKKLGTFGRFSTFSFHETKNIHCGEGGAIILNNPEDQLKAEILREKGTNRSQFLRGQQDKYTWIDLGSSYLPSELNAAFLYAQLQELETINQKRIKLWNYYKDFFISLNLSDVELLLPPKYAQHNGHLFAIKVENIDVRTRLIAHLKSNGISASFHYVPLHTSPAGARYSEFRGEDVYTTKQSERLIRLPLFYELKLEQIEYICETIKSFYIP